MGKEPHGPTIDLLFAQPDLVIYMPIVLRQ
jgi:hypothetical protein